MLTNIKAFKFRVGGVNIVLNPYGFDDSGCHEECLNPNDDLDHLTNCFSVNVHGTSILRTGPLNTPQKLEEFNEVVKLVDADARQVSRSHQRHFRVTSIQLNHPDTEWDQIVHHDHLITELQTHHPSTDTIPHLNFPLHTLFLPKKRTKRAPGTTKMLNRLPKLQNTVALMRYCQWLNDEMEHHLEDFLPDASDEYQLEGCLQDVSNEIHSVLLRGDLEQLNKRVLEQSSAYKDEKEIIAIRERLQNDLRSIHGALTRAEESIGTIEDNHPELLSMKGKIMLMRTLLQTEAEVPKTVKSSWGQTLMILLLLNKHFDVVSAINCDSGLGRTSIVFSIALSLAQLQKEYSMNRIADMVIHWDETTQALNRVIARDGVSPEMTESAQAKVKQRTALVIQLREYILANLQAFSIPITALSLSSYQSHFGPEWKENLEILNFLPSYGEIYMDVNEIEMIKIVDYHPLSGQPTALTTEGHQLLEKLAYLPESDRP